MVRVVEVEESGPLLLPDLVLLGLLMRSVRAGGLLRWHRPLKPHLPQKHVQREGPHHEARIEGEPGSEGLHALSHSVWSFNSVGA